MSRISWGDVLHTSTSCELIVWRCFGSTLW